MDNRKFFLKKPPVNKNSPWRKDMSWFFEKSPDKIIPFRDNDDTRLRKSGRLR